jgi:hypothetical protein
VAFFFIRQRRHYFPSATVNCLGASPQEYVRLVALAFIRRAPASKIRDEGREQPSLFSLLDC